MRFISVATVLLGVFSQCLSQTTLQQETCDPKRLMVNVGTNSANAVIGGIFDIRMEADGTSGCGQPHPELLLSYEAARYAINKINSDNYIQGIRLGMKAYDTCRSPFRSITAAKDFYPQSSTSSMYCNDTQKINLGILGAFTSWTTKPVAELTGYIPAAMISPRAASPSLSDTEKYPYFMRTAPSSSHQSKAMVALLKQLKWNRVVLVYTNDDYGEDSKMEFIKQTYMEDVCVVQELMVSSTGSVSELQTSLSSLGSYGVKAAVFFGSNAVAERVVQAAVNNADGDIQWVLSSVYLRGSDVPEAMRGVLHVQPDFTDVTEFYNYFVTLDENNPPAENPWYQDWFMTVFKCKLSGINYAPYNSFTDVCTAKTQQDKLAAIDTEYPFIDTTIKAVYAFARALKTAQQRKCGSLSTFCPLLQQMNTEEFFAYLKNVNFQFQQEGINIPSMNADVVDFDENGDSLNTDYTVWNFRSDSSTYRYMKVATYTNGALTMTSNTIQVYSANRQNPLSSIPESPCPAEGCRSCVIPMTTAPFYYYPGDLVIGGLFDFHGRGEEPFSCGDLMFTRALSAAAFLYGVQNAKTFYNRPEVLRGVDLGALLVDLCNYADNGRMLFNNLLGGNMIVQDMHGQVVDPHKVKVVGGAIGSDAALSMAQMFTMYRMPQIDATASSASLSPEMFPYFTRSVPSDMEQMTALVQALKKLDWTYIQVINLNNNYGRIGKHVLRNLGAKHGICIAADYEIGTDGNYNEIVSALKNNPSARAVVIIAYLADLRGILSEIKSQSLQGQFLLIGTETWATRESVVSGLEDVAKGSLSIEIMSPPITSFVQWLNTKSANAQDLKNMPFLKKLYQHAHNCYLDSSDKEEYPTLCPGNFPLSNGVNYEETAYLSPAINAGYAAAGAVHLALMYFCGNYDGVCSEFRSARNVGEIILQYMRNSSFIGEGNVPFKMVDGEGIGTYNIYNYKEQSSGQYDYEQVASYNTETMVLDMNTANIQVPTGASSAFMSRCSGRCGECVYILQQMPFVIQPGLDLKIGVNMAMRLGDTGSPFRCGDIRVDYGVQNVLALAYAIETVNKGTAPVSLNGVDLGTIILDHCNSPARASGLPAALYAGILEGQGQEEVMPDVKTIRAWFTDNTLVTEEMKDLVKELNIPIISPSSTSMSLAYEDEYPTYFRTVKGDLTVSLAIATLAKSLNFLYVSVVHSASAFGRDGKEAFSTIAQQEGVCIINSFEMGTDGTAADIISSLVDSSSHVVIVYLGRGDLSEFLDARLANQAALDNLVIISPEAWTSLLHTKGSAARDVLTVNIDSPQLQGYRTYITNTPANLLMNSPFVGPYYEALFGCDLPGNYRYGNPCDTNVPITSSPKFYQDNYVLPLINAVYAFTAAAHATLKEKCGDNYSGVCMNFYSDEDTNAVLMRNLEDVHFDDPSSETFRFINREGSTGHVIRLFDGTQFRKFGKFAGATMQVTDPSLQTRYANIKSDCLAPCLVCIQNTLNFTYIPGDILLGGIFDVHEGEVRPFSCGEIKTLHGFQLLEAFNFAINNVNDKSGQFANILNNVKLGGVGLDACESKARSGYLLSNIHNGITVLQRNGDTVDPDSIDAYIGTYTSDSSLYVARILKKLEIPQISFGATSTELLDQDRYPYFLRTVPADDKQSVAMMKFLDRFNIRYVQVVHTNTNYGNRGAAIFKELAESNQICVAQTVQFPDNGTVTRESANKVVATLLKKGIANTVIVFADTTYVNQLLKAVERNLQAHGKFKFIGSDSWSNNPAATSGVESYAEGSVTLDLDITDLKAFDEYMSTKTPANYPENPWFSEYYENIQNCYLTVSTGRYPSQCPVVPKDISASKRYKQDTFIVHVINAVYAAAYGIDNALKEKCGPNYATVCEAFKNAPKRREIIRDHLEDVQFTDPTGMEFRFTDRRDGNKGYVMYAIEPSVTLGHVYSPIAKFSYDEELTMIDSSYQPSWDGSCERQDSCTECPTVRNLGTRYMLQPRYNPSNQNPVTVVGLYAVHAQGTDNYRCGRLRISGFLDTMAFFYTLKEVGPKPFDIRGLVVDNCNNDLRLNQDIYSLISTGSLCNSVFNTDGDIMEDSIGGVLTRDSRFVVAANRALAPSKVALLSSSATSTALSDKSEYPYFARTVPPDDKQTITIARILKANNWKYVSVVYTTESYGLNGLAALQSAIKSVGGSCIGLAAPISPSASEEDAKAVVEQLDATEGADVVILMTFDPRLILAAAADMGIASKFQWIGTDAWGTSLSIIDGLSNDDVNGAITIGFRSSRVDEFINWLVPYMNYTNKHLYDHNNWFIPDDWYDEFYQMIHKCHLPSATVVYMEFERMCDVMNEKITDEKRAAIYRDTTLTNIAATYAISRAIQQFKIDFCDSTTLGFETFTECLNSDSTFRDRLFKRLVDVTWSMNDTFTLYPKEEYNLELGDDRFWDLGYRIWNLQDGRFDNVGFQSGEEFLFNSTAFRSYKSIVSDCPDQQLCVCDFDTQTSPEKQTQTRRTKGEEPRNYFLYNDETGEKLYLWPVWAIVVAVLTCCGLAITIFLFFYLLIAYPIKGGTSALGFLTIVGIAAIYGVNFAFFSQASEEVCGARRFCLGIMYTIAFAALFIKAIDNWRFSDMEYSSRTYRGMTGPCTLLLIALGIILVQVIIPIQWLILVHPTASALSSSGTHDWMWCDPPDFYDVSLVLSMIFVMFLVLLTAIFAALAWDSESNYYESRWIFVACVCTAGCFLVWMIVSTNAGPVYRDPAVAIGNFVNATALLICIPLRKFVLLCYFTYREEKEELQPVEPGQELYSAVYPNQGFEGDMLDVTMDEKPGSDVGF